MTDATTVDAERVLNRRQTAKRRTAANVLNAARSEFQIRGYEKGTIRAIAKACGMSTGAIFANYRDKAELYTAAIGHPPISPEVGKALMKAVQALQLADALDEAADSEAYGLAHRYAADALVLAKAPPIPAVTGLEPADTVQRFLEAGIPS